MKLVVLLGNENDSDGNLSPVAISRADTAVHFLNKNNEWLVLPTGAFGAHFNSTKIPHGQYLTNYLLANGILANRILPPTNSANTIQDAIWAKKRVASSKVSHLVVITSDFHMQRVKFIFGQLFAGMTIEYLSAPNQVNPPTLDKLLAHETRALRRLRENWEQLFPQTSQIGERPFPDKK